MVDDLRESVRQAKEIAQTEAENVRRTKQELATVSRLQNSRLDNLRNVLDLERKSLVDIYDQVKSTRMNTAVEIDAIALLVQRITSYVSVHDDVQNLENGIDELIHQKLTTKLIPLSQMEVALAHANADIQPLGAGLCYRTAQEVYASRLFDYARFGRDLVIRLHLPYYKVTFGNSRMSPVLGVFTVKTFPMAVPGKKGLITELEEIPKLMVISASRDKVGTIEEMPLDGIVRNEDVTWYKNESCVFAIINNRPEVAQQVCKFVVKKEEITPQATKLKDYGESEFYVITNVTNARVNCEDATGTVKSELSPANCTLCFLKLQCQCNMTAEGLVLEKSRPSCDVNESSSSEVLHAVNLVLLQKFYDLTNESVDAELLRVTEQVKSPQDIIIPLFSENTTRLLTQDQKQAFALNQTVDAMANTTDHISYSSAEALLLDYIQAHPTGTFF
jgi:hypothetical protein